MLPDKSEILDALFLLRQDRLEEINLMRMIELRGSLEPFYPNWAGIAAEIVDSILMPVRVGIAREPMYVSEQGSD
jgi:hypothetical protein